ncbi:hypothetical protein RhiirA1_479828 [Rhizophagus irregularis]|uniref:Uncharacterized protein n=1 Tax=Rhizophagus irregularis TaxID=588596 RepID=A0A2N0QQ45_9GLOM|nr:hypothetical protein RhiirA1_479828 [Rhizophagus irregularis]GET59695.1 hypothetical protein RIR_jg41246.t1 [Rhizophagus irregularis DAOM 181602=DAOM 197198]
MTVLQIIQKAVITNSTKSSITNDRRDLTVHCLCFKFELHQSTYLSITSKELAINFGIEISSHVLCFSKISWKKGDRAYKTEKWTLKTLLSTFIITSLNSFSL